MFNKYYQDELSFLRELGAEFSKANEKAAPFLGLDGTDPDVERLLEGFAFLTGRVRQKIEDEFPELVQALMQLLWPHYLRPIPSMAILQFEPLPQAMKESHRIPRRVEVNSVPVDGTPCRFQTVYDVEMHPVLLESVELQLAKPPVLRLKFNLPGGVQLTKLEIPSLRLHLHGEPAVTRALYLCLLRRVQRIVLRPEGGGTTGKAITLDAASIRPVGFSPLDALLPSPPTSFDGFRLLQEYFAFADKFLFVDLNGLEKLRELGEARGFEAAFEFERLPEDMPALGAASLLLNCTPVVNLFRHDADPIRLDPARLEYRIRPAAASSSHYEIHSVCEVTGLVKGTAEPREYLPFFSFSHSLALGGEDASFYRTRLESSVVGDGTEMYISFVSGDGSEAGKMDEVETVSLELLCTNRKLPSKLRLGDINAPTSSSPVFAHFRNITKLTPPVAPPLGGTVYWRALAHLSLNYHSLHRVESLREVLGLYNFGALVDRQAAEAGRRLLEGIKQVQARPATRLFRGMPVRGIDIRIDLEEDNFAGEGDMYLFATLLNEFFALYVTLNAFSQLTVKGLRHGEEYRWPPRIGERSIL